LTASVSHSSLALLVHASPFENRVARADLDIALAAAALDFEIQVYFFGRSILQLATERNSVNALLPGGYRAWSAMPELVETVVYAEKEWLGFCSAREIRLVMDVEGLDPCGMAKNWRQAHHVLVL
jgi:sulfur relay (sulfurtransferase) DsrF/TusC family protein